MAPEQILGGVVDARTDIYGLGCCAYELLVGQPLVAGASMQAILAQHLADEGVDFSSEGAVVPPALRMVIRKCVAHDPNDRFASMDELEAGLCEAQISLGLRSTVDDLPAPAVGEARRRRIAAGLVAPRSFNRARWSMMAVAASLTLAIAGIGGAEEEPSKPLAPTRHAREFVRSALEANAAPAELTQPQHLGGCRVSPRGSLGLEDRRVAMCRLSRDEP